MAQVPDRCWWDDECIRHVQRPGDELLAPSAGHGAGRHAAKIFRKNEFESASALGGHPLLRRVLGGLTGAIACGMFPLLLLILATVEGGNEVVLGMNGLAFGALIMVGGFVCYLATDKLRRNVRGVTAENAETV